jgi:hypothetical protein
VIEKLREVTIQVETTEIKIIVITRRSRKEGIDKIRKRREGRNKIVDLRTTIDKIKVSMFRRIDREKERMIMIRIES